MTCSKIFLQIVNTRWVCSLIHIWIHRQWFKDYSILIGCEVPDINYFLALIKHYFFSQFYNYKKNKSLQIKAFIVSLNPDTDVLSTLVSFITRYKLMNYTQKTSSWYYLTYDNKNCTCILTIVSVSGEFQNTRAI